QRRILLETPFLVFCDGRRTMVFMGRDDDERGGESRRFNAPFRELAKLVGPLSNPTRRVAAKPRPVPKSPQPASSPLSAADDLGLFEAAVRGVVPIPADERRRVAPARLSPAPSAMRREEDEALAE